MADHILHQTHRKDVTVENATDEPGEQDPRVEARKRRITSLRRVAGIWADRADIPADALQYERELRNEWR
jgi:hypothetical protein